MNRNVSDMGVPESDICVIGTDQAGLDIAFAAAGLGVPTVLVTQQADPGAPPEPGMMRRLQALGVGILEGMGCFSDPQRLRIGENVIRARRYVLATGATPLVPPIPGIGQAPRWDGNTPPQNLLILGANAQGAALAQHARRTGARVTLLTETTLLAEFDFEAADVLRAQFEREGIFLREHVRFDAGRITADETGGTLAFDEGPGPITFSRIALDCGMVPNIEAMALDRAGITRKDGQLVLSAALRTKNRRVYAAGAVTGRTAAPQHAKAQAGAILSEILFRGNGTLDATLETRLALTAPGIAEIGLSERDIPAGQTNRFRFYRVSLAETGRSRPEGAPAGQIKVITTPKGMIKGVSILAPDAAELIVPLALAMAEGKPLSMLARLPIAAPSHAEAIGILARQAVQVRLHTPLSRWLIRFLRRFG